MAYCEELANRVREVLTGSPGLSERKMFGGMAFMLNGNMVCGVAKDDLVLRLGAAGARAALEEPHARELDFTGRPMGSFVMIGPPGYAGEQDLRRWVLRALEFASALPPKK